MMRKLPSVRLCILLLLMVCLWRALGSPVSVQDVAIIPAQLVQARILLPSRVQKILNLWYLKSEAPASAETEKSVLVYLTNEERMEEMPVSEYVCGVLAAEMPAQYHLEALKAQAVAARTRVMRQMLDGCSLHPGADICTDSSHCQGYAGTEERKERWADSFDAYQNRIEQAERETAGQWISYDGEPITVLYHAMSGGVTEDAQTVFAKAQPYLVSVESKGEENARGFWQERVIRFDEAAEMLTKARPSQRLTAEDIRQTLSITGYTESGRVKSLQVGEEEWDAVAFRNALGLRSTWFSMSMNENGITFQQRGYGHGVGMSQVGANAMAASGADYQQILLHYYPGVYVEGCAENE